MSSTEVTEPTDAATSSTPEAAASSSSAVDKTPSYQSSAASNRKPKSRLTRLLITATKLVIAVEFVLYLRDVKNSRSAWRSRDGGWAAEPSPSSSGEDAEGKVSSRSAARQTERDRRQAERERQRWGRPLDEVEQRVHSFLQGKADMESLDGLSAVRVATILEGLGTDDLELLGAQDVAGTKEEVKQLAAAMRAQIDVSQAQ